MSLEGCEPLVFKLAPKLYSAAGRVATKYGFASLEDFAIGKLEKIAREPISESTLSRVRSYEAEDKHLGFPNFTGLIVPVKPVLQNELHTVAALHQVELQSLFKQMLVEAIVDASRIDVPEDMV